MKHLALAASCALLAACSTPSTPDSGLCSALTCRGCCDSTGACRIGAEANACGTNGFQCVDCSSVGQICGGGGVCSSTSTGGGTATGGGGGSVGGGGGSIGGGGGSIGGGGGSIGGGGGSIGGGGGSVGGGGGSVGGGGGSVGGGGGSVGGGGGAVGGGGGSIGGGGGSVGGGGGSVGGGGGSATGGGGGSATGGGGGSTCTPESDATFCTRLNAECGTRTANDNCGTSRTVTSCGTCMNLQVCGSFPTPNQCGTPGITLTETPVAPDNRGAGETLIRFDSNNALHAFYVDLVEGDVWHATRIPAGWVRMPAIDAGTATVTIIDAGFEGGQPKLLLLFRTGTSTNPTWEYRIYQRDMFNSWSRQTLTLPTGFTFPPNAVRFENGTSLVITSLETSGQAYPNNCRLTVRRPTGPTTWGAATTASTWGSTSGCGASAVWTRDANGKLAVGLYSVDAGNRWSVVVENPAGMWTRSTTPLSGSFLNPNQFAVSADGTVHLYGSSAVSSQNVYMFGSGIFWTEETVANLGGAPTRLDLSGQNLIFSRVYDDSRTGPNGSLRRISVARVQRTATNTFSAMPVRSWDQDLNISLSGTVGRTLVGLDPSNEPVLLTGRQPSAVGRGLDLTEWPMGTQRTVELDWAEAAIPLDFTFDAQGTPHALFVMGETSYGLSRLVVRSRVSTSTQWAEGQNVLGPIPGNGNGVSVARLRFDSMGRKRVLVPALYSAGAGSLILATETTPLGTWQREEVVRFSGFPSTIAVDFTLDANDQPHVVYADTSAIYYTTKSGGSWTTPQVAAANTGTAPRPRLVLDPAGVPTLAFNNGSQSSIGLARRVSGSWQTATFYDGNYYGFELVRDDMGRPCLIHVPLAQGGGGYEVTKDCVSGSTLQTTVINQAPLTLRGAGTNAMGLLQIYGLETFVSSPSLYRQDATSWTLEHLINTWPSDRAFFAVGPAGETGFLVRQNDTLRRYLMRTR